MKQSEHSFDLEHTELLTPEQIESTELVEVIYEIEDPLERQGIIRKVEKVARGNNLLQAFRGMCKAIERRIQDTRREEIARKKDEANLKAAEESESRVWVEPYTQTMYNTGRWVVSDRGIIRNNGKRIDEACHYPVFISKCMATIEDGSEQVQLSWIKNGRLRSVEVGKEQISAANRIVYLSKCGFPVTSENAKFLVAYLDDFEAYNPDIPHGQTTGRFGWVGIGTKHMDFVPYCPDMVSFEVEGFDDLVKSVRVKGDYDVWLTMIKNLRASGRNEVLVYLAASFGSVLIPLLQALPFIVNLYGATGAGKTVALMVAASIWANPAEHAYFSESNSTTNAITKKLGVLNNLPLMLDDLSKIRDSNKQKFTELIYAICSGGGKGRLDRNTNMRAVEKWSNVTLSNLERPLTDETMQGGAINRVLDFEIADGAIFEDGNAVVTVLSQHYGHAGVKWVEYLKAIGTDKIKDLYHTYEQKLRKAAGDSGTPKEQKQIVAAAILLAADELSEAAIFKDGVRLDFDYVFQAIKDIKTTSEMERAYWFTSDYVMQQQGRFKPDSYGDYKGEMWGAFLDDEWTAIIPTAMKQIAESGNFDAGQFIKWLNRNGLLQAGNDNHLAKQIRIKGMDKKIRAYVIKLSEDEETPKIQPKQEELTDTVNEDLQDLPFE